MRMCLCKLKDSHFTDRLLSFNGYKMPNMIDYCVIVSACATILDRPKNMENLKQLQLLGYFIFEDLRLRKFKTVNHSVFKWQRSISDQCAIPWCWYIVNNNSCKNELIGNLRIEQVIFSPFDHQGTSNNHFVQLLKTP